MECFIIYLYSIVRKGDNRVLSLFISMKKLFSIPTLFIFVIIFSQNILYANPDCFQETLKNVHSCVVVEPSSGEILFGKDENQIRSAASTTKIMTAIIALENADLKKLLNVSQSAVKEIGVGGTNAALIPGEKIVLEDALKLMLVSSSNDCANVIAENVFGSKEEFLRKMNEKAKKIGANNTTYTNPIGLDENDGVQYSNQLTTALDLALIARYAMNIEEFRNIVSLKTVTVPPTNKHKEERTFSSTNKILDNTYENFKITGVKTGYTIKAGKVLVSSAENSEGLELISVVIGINSDTVFNCTEALLKYGFSNPNLKELSMRNKPYKVVISGATLLTEPIVLENTVLVPIKELAQSLKINLDWIEEDQTIILQKDGKFIHMGIGKESAFINGNKIKLKHVPLIDNGTSFVPLDYIAEAYGYEAKVDSIYKTVQIDSLPFMENSLSVSESVYYYSNSEPYELKNIQIIDNKIYINSTYIDALTQHRLNLEFFPESRIILIDSRPTYIDMRTEKFGDAIYVPLADFAKNLGMEVFWGANTKTVHMFYKNLFVNPDKNIEDLVPEHFVYASVKDNTPLYTSIGGKVSSYIKGGKVEIIRDKDYKWYYIKSGTISGWTKREYLSIDTKFNSSDDRLYYSETEYFVNNYFNLTSQTNYHIWVDLKKQLINIFTLNEDLWKLERQIPCATGKNISPTIKGTFSISSNRGTWMPAGGNIWVKNYVGFYSSYFFHSVKVNRDGSLYDDTVGTVASAGCIRMPLEASEWFTKNIPVNTTVFIR